MADRLAELLRQRALLQEHLAWLEAEIAAASTRSGGTASASVPVSAPSPAPPAAPTVAQVLVAAVPPVSTTVNPQSSFREAAVGSAAAPSAVGDEILDQYRVSDSSLKTDVRKGCLLYFIGAFLLLGLGVAVLWLAFRR